MKRFLIPCLLALPSCVQILGIDDPIVGDPSSGASGAAGAGGDAGASGTAGTAGIAGTAAGGSAGNSGTAGDSGASGSSGAAGSGGTSGSSGTSGTSGSSGTSGTGGTGANGGAGGTSGQAGSSGTSGSGGIAGTAGNAGAAGSAGTAGSAGLGGNAGTAGSAGTAGVSGSSGTAGTAGTSGSTTGLSCVGLAANCGKDGTDDCCSTAETIQGGEVYYRDWDAANTVYTTKQYPATVASFKLDKYEVTVGRFRAFLNAYDAWRQAGHPAIGEGGDPLVTSVTTSWDINWTPYLPVSAAEFKDLSHLVCNTMFTTNHSWVETATPGATGSETKAINCVGWYEAMAFCLWDGGWVPTEAEWMYAAAGGSQNRAYPWSTPADSVTIDHYYANYGGISFVEAVGTHDLGKGRWGHQDLGGNVYEWTWDVYNDTYPGTPGVPCDNCASTTNTPYRVTRGGGLGITPDGLRTAYRFNYTPSNHDNSTGFRCARLP